jgi:two-component system sensor histidine kinase KdpD
VLARHPEVVCVDELTAGTDSAERRFVAARRLADAGITVVGTVQLGKLSSATESPAGGVAALDEPTLLALADEIELVDVPPSILIDRVRRGEIVPADQVEQALETTYAPEVLRGQRERAFRIVAEHGELQLAAYAGGGRLPGQLAAPESWPSMLACVALQPGMEPLIRRSAALAAQVDGTFAAAAVQNSQPAAGEAALLAGYAALTEQLGGEFAVLAGPAPAAALQHYAAEHGVTEMVLARAEADASGRNPVLRDLVRIVHDAELHVLPAET